MRRHKFAHPWSAVTTLAAASALVLAGCGGGSGSNEAAAEGGDIAESAPATVSGELSLWHFFADREAKAIQSVIDDFEADNPGVTVTVHAGQDDEKLAKTLATGGDLDVAISGSTDSLGLFCSSGSFQPLDKFIERDGVDMGQFSEVAKAYTSFDGKQCALPMLADVYGLYYNVDLLEAAGFTEPPKTLSELKEMGLKLTTYKPDGSIDTLGFNPLMNFYENQPGNYTAVVGGTWMTDGKSSLNDDSWKELLNWQRGFIDEIGYDKLKAFTAGLGDEWSADNAFQTGQLAMNMDGEWRVAFIEDQKPDLNYGTAPFPTADSKTDLYGGGYTTGTIAGIAKGSQNPELAWALLKYLTYDTDAVVKLANGIKNVPTTKDALASPDLEYPEQFQTFLDIGASPNLVSIPATPIGHANQTTLQTFWDAWQSGAQTDADAGLAKVDTDINNALELSEAP